MMGYGPEDKNAVLELTYNYGVKEYDKGNAYAQVCSIQWWTFKVMFYC
jgi:lactoylglutathione lyase